jgi:YD repeat-containing protein
LSFFDVQIARDELGRISQRIENVDGITRLFQYGYDLAGRLENVTRNGDMVVYYTYDANGNRFSAEGESGLVTGTYDDQDRLLTYGGATYVYTANGEVQSKTIGGQTTSYVYDTLENLTQVTLPNGEVDPVNHIDPSGLEVFPRGRRCGDGRGDWSGRCGPSRPRIGRCRRKHNECADVGATTRQ